MFFTFKAASVAGEPPASERTPPPFSKTREGRPTKVACTTCRASKLRCSGDPGCCRRCSSRKLWCEYPSPPQSSSSSSSSGSSSSNQPNSSSSSSSSSSSNGPSSVEASSAVPRTPADEDNMNPAPAPSVPSPFDMSYGAIAADFNMPDLAPPEMAGVLIDDCASSPPSLDIDALWDEHHSSSHVAGTTLQPGSGPPVVDTEMEHLVFNTPDSVSSPKPHAARTPTRPACTCIQRAISTNEATEITMWDLRDPSADIYDTLQRQKAMLAECAELLACQACCTQRAYVMMLLSMCRRLLATLQRICHVQGPPDDRGRLVAASSEGAWPDAPESRKRTRGGASEARRRGYGISIRQQQLDDDDEHLVLHSLISTRLGTLKGILDRLDKVVSQYNWPVHKGICRELLASVGTVSFL